MAIRSKHECNGICLSAYDIGLGDVASGVAYPHPDCDLHGRPADFRRQLRHVLDSHGISGDFVTDMDNLIDDLIFVMENYNG